MKRYRRTQWGILGIVVIYTAVSLATKGWSGEEFFPFFNWSLFSTVPNEKHDYGLRITAVDDTQLEPPLYFEAADQWFAEANNIVAYNAIQDYGKAVRQGEAEAIAKIRPFIETLYLEDKAVQYEVVRRTYTPLERWREGTFDKEEVLTSFIVGEDLR